MRLTVFELDAFAVDCVGSKVRSSIILTYGSVTRDVKWSP